MTDPATRAYNRAWYARNRAKRIAQSQAYHARRRAGIMPKPPAHRYQPYGIPPEFTAWLLRKAPDSGGLVSESGAAGGHVTRAGHCFSSDTMVAGQ